MPSRKAKTNRFLVALCIILALVCGGIFTQSSALPSPIIERTEPDMFVADETDAPLTLTAEPAKVQEDSNSADKPEETPTPSLSPEESPTPAQMDTPVFSYVDVSASLEASPEASSGTWISNESHWMFFVDGTSYKGWLTDLDGKRYYLNENGIMQTGWLEKDGNRYYLDLDGIMQTGDVWIDDKEYHFNADGILDGSEEVSTPVSAEDSEPAKEPVPTQKPKKETKKETKTAKSKSVAPTQAPTEAPAKTPVPDKSIALTFEDGPTEYTEEILNTLSEADAKATFFVQGSRLEGNSATVSHALELGQELGNHGYTHFDLSMLNETDGSAEIQGVDELLNSYVGATTTLLRPPYGGINDALSSYAKKPIILWSVDSKDDSLTSAQEIVDTVLSSAEDGGIILMHDTSSLTAEAVKLLLPALAKEGYTCVSVSELASKHGIELQSGITYSSFNQNK